jgi:hypothetical protein
LRHTYRTQHQTIGTQSLDKKSPYAVAREIDKGKRPDPQARITEKQIHQEAKNQEIPNRFIQEGGMEIGKLAKFGRAMFVGDIELPG